MRKLQLLTKMLLVSAMLFAATSAWAQVSVPEAVYFNDFSSTTGLEIIGNGEFMTDADPAFGKVFHNDPANTSAIRTNYLKLPAGVLSHSATSKEMTIGFWVNKKGEDSFFFTPLFAAYGAAPSEGKNAAPMFVCETRGLIQLNCDGWCDFGINGGGTEFNDGTPYVSTVWLDDGAWHYYTITLTETKAKVYVDGELKNGWTVNGTSNGQKISGLFTSGSSLSYVTLGGNQAWDWGDPDPAFAFDDFAVYDKALSAEQIATIISEKSKAVSTYSITYDFKNFVAEGATSGNLSKGSNPAVGETNNTRSVYYPTTYVEGFCGRIAMNFSSERWSISNTDNDKGLIWNQGADEYFSILGLKAGDKVTINTTSGTIYFSTKGNCTGTYYSGDKYVNTETGIPAQWTQLVSGNTYTILADGQLNLQAKRNNGAAGRAQTKEKLVISSIVIIPSQTETVSAPTISSEAADGGRNVTITSGASDMLSGVTTYYTTDGTTPTSSSTKYTEPFLQSTTATVKAITISNSSAATPSAVTPLLIDMDVIDVPTAAITAVNGINRTVTFSCATEGVTLYYSIKDGEDWGAYVEGNSVVISANTTLKVKATKNTMEAVSDELSFQAGTAIKLNNPSYTIGAYSAGAYTLTLTSTQTDKLLSPTAVIKYTENDGETQTINSGETVNASVGKTYKFWSYVEGYTNSDEVTAVPTYVDVTAYRQEWSNDFKDLAKNVLNSTVNTSGSVTKSGEELVAGYYNITNAGFHSNFGVNNVNWQVRYYGSGKDYNTGLWPYNVNGSMVITDLSAGDVIVFTGDAVTAGTNVSKDVFTSSSNGNSTFVVSADGNATFTPTKSGYIYNVTVYTKRPENVTPTISAVGWATYCSEYALDFTGVTALTAYTASVVGTTVTFNKVSGKVPANTGLLISGETASVPVCASADPVANIMVGVTAETVKSAGTIFVLKKGTNGLGFYNNAKPFTLRANSAYIPAANIPSGATARGFISLDDSATSIKNLTPTLSEGEGAIYTLDGRKANKADLKKGVYLFNGRKVVVK